jgi:ABC-2 type transport system permease protein
VILPPILILQFISGVFLSFSQLPEFLQNFASVFPVKWIAQGFRSVFYPDALKVAEMGGEWNLDQIALVLGAWAIVGLFVTLLTFRWVRKS